MRNNTVSRSFACVLIAASVGAACGSHRESRTPIAAPAPTAEPRALSPRIDALADAVGLLPGIEPDAEHTLVVAALRRLADVVVSFAPDVAETVRATARELERSDPQSHAHADLVRVALQTALDALRDQHARDANADERHGYVVARRATERVDADAPLQPQQAALAAAFRGLTNFAAIVVDEHPPFPTPDVVDEPQHVPELFRQRALAASKAVSTMAQARTWTAANLASARALDALADTLEVAPLTLEPREWQTVIMTMRYEALELQSRRLSVERSKRIRTALLAATDGVAALAHRDGAIRALSDAAREATERIEGRGLFVFQRAQIQDAFRTVADALLIAAHARDGSGESS